MNLVDVGRFEVAPESIWVQPRSIEGRSMTQLASIWNRFGLDPGSTSGGSYFGWGSRARSWVESGGRGGATRKEDWGARPPLRRPRRSVGRRFAGEQNGPDIESHRRWEDRDGRLRTAYPLGGAGTGPDIHPAAMLTWAPAAAAESASPSRDRTTTTARQTAGQSIEG